MSTLPFASKEGSRGRHSIAPVALCGVPSGNGLPPRLVPADLRIGALTGLPQELGVVSAASSPGVASHRYGRRVWRRRLAYAQDATLVVLTSVFLWVHLHAVLGGSLKNIPFVAEQLILVVLFLTRRRAAAVSTRPFDWAVAAVGGWLPLAYQIEHGGVSLVERLGTGLQVIGVSLAAMSILWLGRSFGIVAANRGLKTSGPYRVVRHPIYAAHLVTGLGFLVANLSLVNAALFSTVLVAQLLRIRAEERILTETSAYADYARRVPWRLVPFVY